MKVVLDTNVVVSAVLGGRSREVVRHLRAGTFELVEAAVAGDADVSVSGDAQLLALGPHQGVSVLGVRELIATLEAAAGRT